jgi:trehalose synthase
VAEALWKARPVVASRIGGIQDQIVDGVTGVLVDPADLRRFGEAVVELLGDPARAALMGERARRRVRDEYLGPRLLRQFLRLIERLLRRRNVGPGANT